MAGFKAGDLALHSFKLLEFFSSKMSAKEEIEMMEILWMIASYWGFEADRAIMYDKVAPPGFLNLGGTPLNDAIIAMMEIVPKFKAETGVQKVNTIFLTDGAVGNEGQLFDLISKELKKTRLFTIGIGSAPNAHFMRRAAEIGRGSTISIGEINEVTEQISVLFSKIQNPAVVDLQLILPDGGVAEAYPNPVPASRSVIGLG